MALRKSGPVLLPETPPEAPPESAGAERLRAFVGRHGVLLLAAACGVGAFALLGGVGAGRHGIARGYIEDVPLTIASLRPGRVAEVRVGLGARVKRGDVVVLLDATLLQAQRNKLLAEREVSAAQLGAAADVQDGAVLRTEVWRLRTTAESKQNKAELVALERELARLESLYDRQLVKASDVEPLRRRREALAARVNTFADAASGGLAGLGSYGEKTSHHAESVAHRLLPLREQLRVAEAAIAALDVEIANTELRAPADGVVASLDRRPGEVVAAGDAVVTVAAGRPGVVVAFLPERHVAIAAGAAVSVAGFGFLEGGRPGRVIEVAPDVAEVAPRFRASPSIPVWGRRVVVEIDGQDASSSTSKWVPGQEVRVRF